MCAYGYVFVCVCAHVYTPYVCVCVCMSVVSYKVVCLRSGSLCCCSAIVHQIDLCLLVDDSQC